MIELKDRILQYAQQKEMLDVIKKDCDAQSKQIKDIMVADGLEELEVEGYKASCIVSSRDSINEDLLLTIIERSGINIDGLIKTINYVDTDVLEKAIYNDEIPHDLLLEMDKARESKEVVTLRVTKKKERKKRD